ncbi:MAG: aminotransferase class V-fold PLP-dependent enzyme, partial [Blastocatellia bacterium]
MSERIFNFSAGPAVLPEPILKQAQRDLFTLPGVGMSVLEISHRSAAFEQIIAEAEADLRKLVGIPDNYKVLFLQGGASLQFTMIPMNLLPKGASADYLLTGSWGQGAIKEAKKLGIVREAATTADTNFNRLPKPEEIK